MTSIFKNWCSCVIYSRIPAYSLFFDFIIVRSCMTMNRSQNGSNNRPASDIDRVRQNDSTKIIFVLPTSMCFPFPLDEFSPPDPNIIPHTSLTPRHTQRNSQARVASTTGTHTPGPLTIKRSYSLEVAWILDE